MNSGTQLHSDETNLELDCVIAICGGVHTAIGSLDFKIVFCKKEPKWIGSIFKSTGISQSISYHKNRSCNLSYHGEWMVIHFCAFQQEIVIATSYYIYQSLHSVIITFWLQASLHTGCQIIIPPKRVLWRNACCTTHKMMVNCDYWTQQTWWVCWSQGDTPAWWIHTTFKDNTCGIPSIKY